jgi:O-acetyl-ADP-ribose deacetylase (regulator of RNase III)
MMIDPSPSASQQTPGTRFGRTLLTTTLGDPLAQEVDALVLGTNRRGLMGAGTATFIRLTGGPEIEREAMEQAPLDLGDAITTTSGRLAERGISLLIHAVVSDELGGVASSEDVRRAVGNALLVAAERKVRTLAMPAIGGGTGPEQLPPAVAAEVIVDETISFLRRSTRRFDRIVYVARSTDDQAAFEAAIIRGRARSWGDA